MLKKMVFTAVILAQTVIPPFSPLLSTEKSLTANLADKQVWDIHPS